MRVLANKKLTIPASSITALEDYKTSNNSILLFVKEECQIGANHKVGRRELYLAYKEWCLTQGFKSYANAHTLYDVLNREFNVTKIKTNEKHKFEGIKRA